MCSIFGSFNKSKILELNELNSTRGSFSYSIGYIEPSNHSFVIVEQGFGEPNLNRLLAYSVFNNNYIICHRQAPTSGLSLDPTRIHPAIVFDRGVTHCLYHNGIVKSNYLKRLEEKHQQQFPWDTQGILTDIVKDKLELSLSQLDGSFACVYIKHQIETLIFRNQSSILYYDNDLNLSSEKFANSKELPINKLFKLDILNKNLIELITFDNIEDKYFFAE